MKPYGMKRTCEGCGCRLCRIAGWRVDAKLIVCKSAARREGKREAKYGVLAE